jgi:hypothetical protein
MDQSELRTQLSWITNRTGVIPMDFIGRFENLAEDFSHVAEILGLNNKSLPRLLVGDDSNYTRFYDDEMKDLVFRKYKDEIAIFKYEFED